MNKAKPVIALNLPETGLEHGSPWIIQASLLPVHIRKRSGNKECDHAKASFRGEGQDEGGLREQINRI